MVTDPHQENLQDGVKFLVASEGQKVDEIITDNELIDFINGQDELIDFINGQEDEDDDSLFKFNNLELWGADVGNAYLESYTEDRVITVAGPEFGYREGQLLIVKKSGLALHEKF